MSLTTKILLIVIVMQVLSIYLLTFEVKKCHQSGKQVNPWLYGMLSGIFWWFFLINHLARDIGLEKITIPGNLSLLIIILSSIPGMLLASGFICKFIARFLNPDAKFVSSLRETFGIDAEPL